ncbi:hypothetical protein ACEWX3_05150 [Mycobacterium sp. G7A2]|uniref:hypothetical protein n=1 Tax=Mycobacterium sp. G7A2 TaxID=3317307 RepID=UPI0035A82C90
MADDNDSESKSVITTTELTTTGEPTTPAATGVATTTGATTAPGTPTTVTTVAAGTPFGLPCASVTANDTVDTPAPAAVNVTDANNCRYSDTEADPVNVNTPPENSADTSSGSSDVS